ncbi:MAG TPA: hypothetical protein EYO46_05300 [Candidatus Lambdaproteobacteria bacterium]|nr:hypothetical protein [Candidatus Lambdaproteobacteria bacterium]
MTRTVGFATIVLPDFSWTDAVNGQCNYRNKHCPGSNHAHYLRQQSAAKVVTRVDDGMTLHDAVARTMRESNKFNYLYGLISLDSAGQVEVGKTAALNEVFYAFHDGEMIRTFFT